MAAKPSRLFGLSMAFAVLFLVSWVGHAFAQWDSFTQIRSALGLPTGVGHFFLDFMSRTLENWQSDFLQAFTMVTLGAWLIHRSSSQSKDTTDEIEQTVQRIESRLDSLDARLGQRP